jgi:hypothetical protein
MVASALQAQIAEAPAQRDGMRAFELTLTNMGAAHFLPTGTPDRHLTIQWRLIDGDGEPIREQRATLERTVLWRPFIVDLWDRRLPYRAPRTWRFEFRVGGEPLAQTLQVTVGYHLLDESRRRRIGYENPDPIGYPIFDRRIDLTAPKAPGGA